MLKKSIFRKLKLAAAFLATAVSVSTFGVMILAVGGAKDTPPQTILVTGGAGYIGSHTCVELLNSGYDVVIADNFQKCSPEAIKRVETITGKTVTTYKADIRCQDELRQVFRQHNIYAVMHFAGLKAVGESSRIPLDYYENNVYGTANLCRVMAEFGVKKMIISSSQTVYGCTLTPPFCEDMKVSDITNPYGRTKRIIEEMMMDLQKSDPAWSISLLRYVNPLGAHESGLLGEAPIGESYNLLPRVAMAAKGELPMLRVFGGDYDTHDGTCVRDYIHIVDLAKGHVACLQKIAPQPGVHIYNMATGIRYSVLDVIRAFEEACGRKIPFEIVGRRIEDLPISYADPTKAEREFGFKVGADLKKMCADYWRFTIMNPEGYGAVE